MNAIDSMLILNLVGRPKRIRKERTEHVVSVSQTIKTKDLDLIDLKGIEGTKGIETEIEIDFFIPKKGGKKLCQNFDPYRFLLNTISELITLWHYQRLLLHSIL